MDKAERLRDIARYKDAVSAAAFHSDGYRNMLNKVGMAQDNSTAWLYTTEGITSDMQLAGLYADNGLFAKIIDRPAEDALSKGLDLSDLGEELEKKVKKKLNNLEYTENMILAEKWSRLFGGAIAVMLINDGGGIDEPLNLRKAQGVEEIRVFERAIVQPDYTTLYQYSFFDASLNKMTRWGEPQWYYVYSNYGQFRVHASRCLIFRNGSSPEYINNQMYRFWGIPTYDKIKTALRETVTSHHDGTKLLERSVLGVYKMRNLSNLLASDEGEDKVIQRLQVIDEGRNIINSMAIDAEGEDYSYINASMAGASDIIDRTCNMLSAVTDIPQTILFGKSPSGMDATGEHDMENYYQMLSRMQARDLQKPTEVLVKLILLEMIKKGELDKELPEYEVRFNPLKEMSEEEQANLDAARAGTDMTKAQTAQIYVDMQALDPTEVRKALKQANDYEIQGIIDEDAPDELEIPDDTFDLEQTETENPKKDETGVAKDQRSDMMEVDGGPGSGNFGHAGRPGQRGGSSKGGNKVRSIYSYESSHYQRSEAQQARIDRIKTSNPKDFHDTLEISKFSQPEEVRWRVDIHDVKDYENCDLFVSEGGSCAAVIKTGEDAGDIISISKKAYDLTASGGDMVQRAVDAGGNKLDAFGPKLYEFYVKNGFTPVSRCKFDEKYAPPGWVKGRDKKEDIVFYMYTGEVTKMTYNEFCHHVKRSKDYNSAKIARNLELETYGELPFN